MRQNNATTLLELLIAIVLISVVVLGLSSIDLFSRYHLLTSERRIKIQNEISHALDHMSKEIGRAIGDANQPAVTISGSAIAIAVWYDFNPDGKKDGADRRMSYVYALGGKTIAYCPNATDFDYDPELCSPQSDIQILSNKVTNCNFALTGNYVIVNITTCWAPAQSSPACGTPDNPSVQMTTRIKMPSVSVH